MSGPADIGGCPICHLQGPIRSLCGTAHGRPSRFVPTQYLPEPGSPVDPMVGRQWAGLLVVRKLGHGGSGAVFLGVQGPLRLPVALKLLLPGASTPYGFGLDRFKRQARTLARLDHPGIMRLLSYDVHDGRPDILMEYIEDAVTLWTALRHRSLDIDMARDVLCQLVEIVSAMHRAGIVHRDIKPGNIMLQFRGERCTVRLVDFGLAKAFEESTATAAIAGTLTHMAPEQLSSGTVGPWTDYFALGVVAAEMLLGVNPFTANRDRPLLETRLDTRIDPAATIDQTLPPEVGEFLRSALAWHPRDRLRDEGSFRQALAGAVLALGGVGWQIPEPRDLPMESHPGPPVHPGPPAGLRARLLGHPWALVAAAALLGAVGGLGAYLVAREPAGVTIDASTFDAEPAPVIAIGAPPPTTAVVAEVTVADAEVAIDAEAQPEDAAAPPPSRPSSASPDDPATPTAAPGPAHGRAREGADRADAPALTGPGADNSRQGPPTGPITIERTTRGDRCHSTLPEWWRWPPRWPGPPVWSLASPPPTPPPRPA